MSVSVWPSFVFRRKHLRSVWLLQAVRSTHGLEVPLSHYGKVLVDPDYIHFLTQIANQKMDENLKKIHRSVWAEHHSMHKMVSHQSPNCVPSRFYEKLQSALSAERPSPSDWSSSQELQNPQHMKDGGGRGRKGGEEQSRCVSTKEEETMWKWQLPWWQ